MVIMIFVVFIAFAVVAGLTARRIMPGPDPAGFAGTILIGIAGGLVGGLVGSVFAGVSVTAFDGRSLLLAIAGTLAALFSYRAFAMRWPERPGGEQPATPTGVRNELTPMLLSTQKRA